MSRLFEGLIRTTSRHSHLNSVPPNIVQTETPETADAPGNVMPEMIGPRGMGGPKMTLETGKTRSVTMHPLATSRLVTWTDPNSLGAEKFRALAVRLDDIRSQHTLNSLQVTSSIVNEGKSFVAANLAVTLAKYSGSKTVLVEGDLHRPALSSMLGLKELQGLNEWWSGKEQDIGRFLVRVNGMALWFLPAGKHCDRPSEILRSARLAEAFAQLAGHFDWIVVDSTPMLPVIDANLWSRLVDGTLLVVRAGVTPLKALKNGLQSLDHPKLIGVVVNEASEIDQVDYDGHYYGPRKGKDKDPEKLR